MTRVPAPGCDSISSDQAFVSAAYQDFLGRAPTPTELAAGTARPLTTAAARARVVRSLSTSPEWVRVAVNKLYLDTLGRDGDTGGMNYWVGRITSRKISVAGVAAEFYSSVEYASGEDDAALRVWISDLYRKILLRDGDPGGIFYWVNESARVGKHRVAYSFFQSDESRHTRVKGLYETLLGRGPDRSGWDYWSRKIRGEGDLALAAHLASSAEYYTRASTRDDLPVSPPPAN